MNHPNLDFGTEVGLLPTDVVLERGIEEGEVGSRGRSMRGILAAAAVRHCQQTEASNRLPMVRLPFGAVEN